MKFDKSNKIILIVFSCLFIVISLLASSNISNMNKELELNENGLTIEINNQTVKMFSLQEIHNLKSEEIEITQYSNGGPPVERNLTAVKIIDILELSNVDVNEINEVVVTALDGFSAKFTKDEILDDNKVYIFYLENGFKLDEKWGNFATACNGDESSTRWLKQTYKINVIMDSKDE